MPLISVIVPVYKVEPYLSRCVDSILSQTFTDFELILVDDGSPDNCGKICAEYAQKDNRIQVIHKENGGLSSARNAGIDWTLKNSNSQWLTFIDSDDWIHPQYLELLLSGATFTNTDICVCEYTETSNFSDFEKLNNVNPQNLSPEEFFVNYHITATVAWCKLYKKRCFENIRYPVGKLHEDEYTTYKILFEKNYISYLKVPLYFYYTNSDSIVRSEWSPKRLDAITAYEEQIDYFRKNGHQKALVKVERKLLWYIIAQIETTEKSDEYPYLAPKLKKMLRKCLKSFKTDANLSINNGYDFYIKAYPITTKLYYIVIRILKKLKILKR